MIRMIDRFGALAKIFNNYASNESIEVFDIFVGGDLVVLYLNNPPFKKNEDIMIGTYVPIFTPTIYKNVIRYESFLNKSLVSTTTRS